jgi:PKD repeat protein
MRGFPPQPVYPNAIDNDSTLYAVYNTSESITVGDNQAWSEEITIVPVGIDADEIWAENGFANISGELFYYDLVEKDVNGKIFKFKRCLRNFGGDHTRFNASGTSVRGFVIAEHHKQLADAIIDIEDFVGENFSPDTSTLDWRIRNLQNTPPIFDDSGCPTVVLTIEFLSSDPASGTVMSYTVDITGTIQTFLLQFGDGFQTTSTQPGTHTYAPNGNIDPVVTVTNGNCTITQTAIRRTSSNEPVVNSGGGGIVVGVPVISPFPGINVSIASTDFDLPIIPINFPCLTLGISGISSFNIPSIIDVHGNIPSVIDIHGSIPSVITLSGISIPDTIIISGPSIPTHISITPPIISFTNPAIPSVIVINNPGIPATINFGPLPNFPTIQFAQPFFPIVQFGPVQFPAVQFMVPDFPNVNFGDPPTVSVDWGTPPVISCACSITCPGAASVAAWQQTYVEDLGFEETEESPNVEYNFAGIPSEIKIVPANIPQYIALKHNFKDTINVVVPSIPSISIDASNVPKEIRVIAPEIKDIRLIADDVPRVIKIEHDIPSLIKIENPGIPDVISIDSSKMISEIKITGCPDFITLKHDLPAFISLILPDNKPMIEVKPLDVNISVHLDMKKIMTENGNEPDCFYFVPCGK